FCFFQAEDGIRDYKVTGVQTCALPIWLWVGASVTPNHLIDWQGFDKEKKRPILYLGAVGELYGRHHWKSAGAKVEGEESEPAQVLNCPACREILAISSTTLTSGTHSLHLILTTK